MPKINAFVWEFYILLVALMLVGKYEALFGLNSPQNIYFQILTAFDSWNLFYYWSAVFQVLINIIHIMPLFWVVFNLTLGPAEFWKYMFGLRIIFDLFGHNYEINEFMGYINADTKHALIYLGVSVLLWLPSYIVCYCHAFRKNQPLR